MVPWRRICFVVSLTLSAPLWACGPFLYENSELDRFSLLDPGILNNSEWLPFLSFESPALGQKSSDSPVVQTVIHSDRLPETGTDGVSNLLYDADPGQDEVTVAANEAWWSNYFKSVRNRAVTADELHAALYGPDRPRWLAAADKKYLTRLDGDSNDADGVAEALREARDTKNPEPLRHRWVFWAVRALALTGGDALAVFREFSPGPAADLPLARAQGWAASALLASDRRAALDLWLDLFVKWPELRVQTFSSLMTFSADELGAVGTPAALVARFFLDGRDFSPETLKAVAQAEHQAGGDGSWTETVFYAMAEQIEKESGVFALFGLVDPDEVSPAGLFHELINTAQSLVETKIQPASRTWWLVASYLALFDGDVARSKALLATASALPANNEGQQQETALIAALHGMAAEQGRDWSDGLQKQVVAALEWGKTLDSPGHNRGLYHSVVVLAAQKALTRGHDVEAVIAFGLLRQGWSPYSVSTDNDFWSYGWAGNNSVTLMMDALMSDDDLTAWKTLLKTKQQSPLTFWLAERSFLNGRDLAWWQGYRALRRGDAANAVALFKAVPASESGSEFFPDRTFSYSLNLDPQNPGSGRAMRTVAPAALASVMARIEADAKERPSSRTLLAQGEFWFSLQLSGMPLLFDQPPQVISFTNGNFEYYGYDGHDVGRSTNIVADFPLGRPRRTDEWARRLKTFYGTEFSTLGRARAAFEAVLARHEDLDAEYRALLYLQAIDGNRQDALADTRYDNVGLAQEFRSTCEDFQNRTL